MVEAMDILSSCLMMILGSNMTSYGGEVRATIPCSCWKAMSTMGTTR